MNSVENGENIENNKNNEIPEEPLSIFSAVSFALFFLKFILVAIVVLSGIYILNVQMGDFLAKEEIAEHARLREIEEALRATEDYERANEYHEISDHYDGQFQEIFLKRVNADYIFIGTSHVTHGVTPEAFENSGKRFFNFALNGSNPSYYVWWYNSVFKQNKYVKPKAILFGVDWFMFDTGWLWRRPEFDRDYIQRYPSMPPPDSDGDMADWDVGSTVSPVYKFPDKWYDIDEVAMYVTTKYPFFSARKRLIELVLPVKTGETEEPAIEENLEEKPVNSGTALKNRPTEPIYSGEGCRLDLFYKGYVPYQPYGHVFSGDNSGYVGTTPYPEEIEAFIKLLDQFEAEGIPVIFFMAPEYLPGRNAPQFDELTDELTYIAIERGIPFLNYNRELASDLNSDKTAYSDWGHLNDKGAQAFSKALYEDLKPILGYE